METGCLDVSHYFVIVHYQILFNNILFPTPKFRTDFYRLSTIPPNISVVEAPGSRYFHIRQVKDFIDESDTVISFQFIREACSSGLTRHKKCTQERCTVLYVVSWPHYSCCILVFLFSDQKCPFNATRE